MEKKEKIIPYSELGRTGRQKLKDIVPLEKPFTLFIETTNACNFKCVQCPHGLDEYGELAGPIQHMKMGKGTVFNKLVSDLLEWKKDFDVCEPFFKVIRLYLEGEPLLNRNYTQMLKILKEENLAGRVELVTNGSMLTPNMCKELVKYQMDYIKISIYSILEDKHRAITKTNISPEQIRDNILLLKSEREKQGAVKPYIHVKMIDTFNEKENNQFNDYYKEIADEICIDKPMNWNGAKVDFIDKLYGEETSLVKEKLIPNTYRKVCSFPFHTLAVKSNGDVVVCCVDWLRETKVGNILKQTLKEIWNGKELYEFRKMHLEGKRKENKSCAGCDLPMSLSMEDNMDEFKLDNLPRIQ